MSLLAFLRWAEPGEVAAFWKEYSNEVSLSFSRSIVRYSLGSLVIPRALARAGGSGRGPSC